MNTFESLRQILNASILDGVITRKGILEKTGGWKHTYNTVDNYRNWFTKAGYLIVLRPGVYHMVKAAPFGLTGTMLRKQAYPDYYNNPHKKFRHESSI